MITVNQVKSALPTIAFHTITKNKLDRIVVRREFTDPFYMTAELFADAVLLSLSVVGIKAHVIDLGEVSNPKEETYWFVELESI